MRHNTQPQFSTSTIGGHTDNGSLPRVSINETGAAMMETTHHCKPCIQHDRAVVRGLTSHTVTSPTEARR